MPDLFGVLFLFLLGFIFFKCFFINIAAARSAVQLGRIDAALGDDFILIRRVQLFNGERCPARRGNAQDRIGDIISHVQRHGLHFLGIKFAPVCIIPLTTLDVIQPPQLIGHTLIHNVQNRGFLRIVAYLRHGRIAVFRECHLLHLV